MGISYADLSSYKSGWTDGMHWLADVENWCEAYEAKTMVPHYNNKKTAEETTAILLYLVPKPLKQAGRNVVSVLMSDRLRKAMM